MPKSPRSAGTKPCCLVSEVLEEAGLDREKARRLCKQVLEGVILLCRWQLERLENAKPASRPRVRRVTID